MGTTHRETTETTLKETTWTVKEVARIRRH
jgi:hypothetical protein